MTQQNENNYCSECHGRGYVDIGIIESPVTVCKVCNGTGFKKQPKEPTQCWKCGDMDAEFQAKCNVPACGMKEGKTP